MRFLALCLAFTTVLAVGCKGKDAEVPGYTKEDFAKRPPPPEYRGPGQPGAPGNGPGTAPPGPPPGYQMQGGGDTTGQ